MSGCGTPDRLRMNPPVSRWAVAPSPESHMRTRQRIQSECGRWASCSQLSSPVCLPRLGAWHQGLYITSFFLQVTTPSTTASNGSYMLSEGLQVCKGYLVYEPFHILLCRCHLEQAPVLSPLTVSVSCPLAAVCQTGPLCSHLTEGKMGLGDCHPSLYLAT